MAVDFTPLRITGGTDQFKTRAGTTVLGRIDVTPGSSKVHVSIQDGGETYRRYTLEAGKLLAFLQAESEKRELCLPADPGKMKGRPAK